MEICGKNWYVAFINWDKCYFALIYNDVSVNLNYSVSISYFAFHLVKRWFVPAAARARGQSDDLNREILASNLFNCHKEVINAPPVPSISRCIHIVYRHKNVWEYQLSNFIYNCMSTFLHYVRCKDALLDCSTPGGERCESLTWVDEICDQAIKIVACRKITGMIFIETSRQTLILPMIYLCIKIWKWIVMNIFCTTKFGVAMEAMWDAIFKSLCNQPEKWL